MENSEIVLNQDLDLFVPSTSNSTSSSNNRICIPGNNLGGQLSTDKTVNLEHSNIEIERSSDVIIGPVTQFHAPVTIIQSRSNAVQNTSNNSISSSSAEEILVENNLHNSTTELINKPSSRQKIFSVQWIKSKKGLLVISSSLVIIIITITIVVCTRDDPDSHIDFLHHVDDTGQFRLIDPTQFNKWRSTNEHQWDFPTKDSTTKPPSKPNKSDNTDNSIGDFSTKFDAIKPPSEPNNWDNTDYGIKDFSTKDNAINPPGEPKWDNLDYGFRNFSAKFPPVDDRPKWPWDKN